MKTAQLNQCIAEKHDIRRETLSGSSVSQLWHHQHRNGPATNLTFEYALAIGRPHSQRQWTILQIATGTKSNVVLNLKSLVRTLIQDKIESLILCHNHPVGDPSPSRNDIRTTRSIHQLCVALSVNLTDHIIIGRETCFSFRDAGYL